MSERRAEDGWIEWTGGECPVPDETRVEVRNAKGWIITADAWAVKWANVAAYRVVAA